VATTLCKVDKRSIAPARKRLQDMKARADNLMAAWEVLLDWFANQNRVQFGSRGERWRTPWAELKPRTVIQKRREGFTGDILVANTNLLRSMSDRPLAFERITAHEVEAGTNVSYAKYHQYGTKYMPARPLVSAEQVAREGAASSAVISWIVSGRASVNASEVHR
jgi:phage gpG-like protein